MEPMFLGVRLYYTDTGMQDSYYRLHASGRYSMKGEMHGIGLQVH